MFITQLKMFAFARTLPGLKTCHFTCNRGTWPTSSSQNPVEEQNTNLSFFTQTKKPHQFCHHRCSPIFARVHPKTLNTFGKASSFDLGFCLGLRFRGRLVNLAHNRPGRSMRLLKLSLQRNHVSHQRNVVRFLSARGTLSSNF